MQNEAGQGRWALAVGAIAAGVATSWALGAIAIWVEGKRVRSHHAFAGIEAIANFADPGHVWGVQGVSALCYWAIVAPLMAVLVGSAWAGWVLLRRVTSQPTQLGLASSGVARSAAGPRALIARGSSVRPTITNPAAADLGIPLGRSVGGACWASVEDSMVVLGPPRSGKGLHLVIPSILSSPGSVVTTSTRPDNLRATLTRRRGRGPVAVFDPQGLAGGAGPSMKWSPIAGCHAPGVAMARARALCADPGGGLENGSFWAQQCYTVVRCLLHAAALGNRTTADLAQWSLSPMAAEEAADTLRTDHRAAPTWAAALDATLATDPKQRDSVWAMVSNVFAPLADPAVLDALSPGPDDQFDAEAFLKANGTLYLLGTASGASATANIVNALIEEVIETARRIAAGCVGGRLEPPLALVLDEAANYPLPSLLSLVSEGGGSGISTQVVLQSMAQARAKWGNDEAAAVWDAAIVKIILGGSANAGDLRDLSALAGTRDETRVTHSWNGDGRRTSSTSERERPVLDIGMLRTIPFGHAILLLRSTPPIRLALKPWTTTGVSR